MATENERSEAMRLELAKVYAQGKAEIGRMRGAAVQLALKQVKAEQTDCITVGGLVAVLIGETARAAGLASMDAATSIADAREAHTAFIESDESWSAWLKEAVGRRELLVRELATLGPANATPAVRQWTESSAAGLPGYVAAMVVLKADARRWLDGIGVPVPPSLQGADEAVPLHPAPAKETTEQRQQRRYQMCVDAGLVMPTNDYAALPRGIGQQAEKEGITRQAFSEDVKAHVRRLAPRNGR
jgi:hypothetical protein